MTMPDVLSKVGGVRLMVLLVTLLLIIPNPAVAFFRNTMIGKLANARMDPIVSPGEVSGHCHHLNGGSNMSLNSTGQTLLASNCTNSVITQDNSNYWAPWMFFQYENGSFTEVQLAMGLTAYYKYEIRPSAPPNASYGVFPQNFRMISGTSPKRQFYGPWPVPQMSEWGPADMTQSALAEKALGFNCLHYYTGTDEASFAYPYLRNKTFIDSTCTDGIRAEVLFPSCWDGVHLDSEDHKTHVAFPDNLQGGNCPDTHPVYLPILFYETIWNTQEFANIPGQFVFANGDPTGYGYHADFMAAWPDGLQEQVQNNAECTNINSTGEVQDCPLFKLQPQEVADQCKLKLPEVLRDEQTSGILPLLPGHNPISGVQHAPDPRVVDSVPAVNSQTSTTPTSSDFLSTTMAWNSNPLPINTLAPTSSILPVITPPPATTNIYTGLPTMSSTVDGSDFTTTTTTAYTTSGYVLEIVIVEDIDTVTVTVPYVETATAASNMTSAATPATSSYTLTPGHVHKHVRNPRRRYGHHHS